MRPGTVVERLLGSFETSILYPSNWNLDGPIPFCPFFDIFVTVEEESSPGKKRRSISDPAGNGTVFTVEPQPCLHSQSPHPLQPLPLGCPSRALELPTQLPAAKEGPSSSARIVQQPQHQTKQSTTTTTQRLFAAVFRFQNGKLSRLSKLCSTNPPRIHTNLPVAHRQLPLGLLNAAQGHPMLVELKNGETLNGHLVLCDTWMNLTLREVVQTSPVGFSF